MSKLRLREVSSKRPPQGWNSILPGARITVLHVFGDPKDVGRGVSGGGGGAVLPTMGTSWAKADRQDRSISKGEAGKGV